MRTSDAVGGARMAPTSGPDDEVYRDFVAPHLASLHAHCYRMLGSVHDADDALQDALLRAWRGLDRFEGRSAARSWLHRIATNVCLDAIARRPKRMLPIDYGSSASPDDVGEALEHSIWIEPYPSDQLGLEADLTEPEARYEQRESLELAFIAALQHLPGRQRAVLILRDVLGFSAKEVAEALETTTASVNSALQRARKSIDEKLPARSQQETMRSLGDERVQETVTRFIDAFERGEIATILDLLTDDASFAMPPYAQWQQGRDAIADSWLMPGGEPPRLRYVRTMANGQPALGTYQLDSEAESYVPIALDVLTLDGSGISAVIAFRTPEIFPAFGLPSELPRTG